MTVLSEEHFPIAIQKGNRLLCMLVCVLSLFLEEFKQKLNGQLIRTIAKVQLGKRLSRYVFKILRFFKSRIYCQLL